MARATGTRIIELIGDWTGKDSLDGRTLEMLLEGARTMLLMCKELRRSTSDIMLDTRDRTTRSTAVGVLD